MTEEDKMVIFQLAQKITGAHPEGTYRHNIFITNIQRRMQACNITELSEYLKFANSNAKEQTQLISSLSIHTTSWFRENPHYVILQKILLTVDKRVGKFRLWCAASSSGEEVYSFALLLEEFRRFHSHFDYEILGTDIDPVSIELAKNAVYQKKHLSGPVAHYMNHILYGSGKTEDLFTFTRELRQRCTFQTHDIRLPLPVNGLFDIVICRNVLIYFSQAVTEKVVGLLTDKLAAGGHLILGHSEIISHNKFNLDLIEHSVYIKSQAKASIELNLKNEKSNKIKKILVVDDQKLAREIISNQLKQFGYDVLMAETTKQAEEHIAKSDINLITLDLTMPDMRGDEWLRLIRRRGVRIPVVVISESNETQAAGIVSLLEEGSLAYIEKKETREQPEALPQVVMHLLETHHNLAPSTKHSLKNFPPDNFKPDVIVIGASTGGPGILANILDQLPPWTPPIVIVQHINTKFAKSFAERMAQVSSLTLGNIRSGEILKPGHIYAALGDYHLAVQDGENGIVLRLQDNVSLNGHRPSVDHLFKTAAHLKRKCVGILLTGMGKDGAQGMLELHKNGTYTIAQDHTDSIVFGMPKEAIEKNAVDFAGSSSEIKSILKDIIKNLQS